MITQYVYRWWGWLALALGLAMALPFIASAQDVHQDLQETVRATVVSIDDEFERRITGTDATATVQELTIEVREGARAGEEVSITNDLVMLKPGDSIIVNRLEYIDGTEQFVFKDAERRGWRRAKSAPRRRVQCDSGYHPSGAEFPARRRLARDSWSRGPTCHRW